MSGSPYRFRRYDSRNYTIEKAYGKDGRFRVLGYYGSPEAMCRAAVRDGIGGDSVKGLLASIESAYAKAVDALHKAIADGTLQLGAKSRKAREKRTATAGRTDLDATDDKDD